MSSKAIVVPWHKYTPYGDKYYNPIFWDFLNRMTGWLPYVDRIYFIDSTWNIDKTRQNPFKIIRVNSNLRYYDAYKEALPHIEEDQVLFLDNDMVIYQPAIIDLIFKKLEDHGVVSIYDTIGDYKTDKLNGKNKFCPYLFASRKATLMEYLDVEWGPNMPEHETFGGLTKAMLDDGLEPYEMIEDKSNCLFGDGSDKKSKDLGYYHIRAGTTPAVLLAWQEHNEKEYRSYIKNQPRSEYLRQIAWYWTMLNRSSNELMDVLFTDLKIDPKEWSEYIIKFKKFHGI